MEVSLWTDRHPQRFSSHHLGNRVILEVFCHINEITLSANGKNGLQASLPSASSFPSNLVIWTRQSCFILSSFSSFPFSRCFYPSVCEPWQLGLSGWQHSPAGEATAVNQARWEGIWGGMHSNGLESWHYSETEWHQSGWMEPTGQATRSSARTSARLCWRQCTDLFPSLLCDFTSPRTSSKNLLWTSSSGLDEQGFLIAWQRHFLCRNPRPGNNIILNGVCVLVLICSPG